MVSRIRIALGMALLLTLIASITVFAKGGFSFITITGPNLKEAVRATDSALTADFFAFADFYQDRTEAPANPGTGYEINRYYVDGKSEINFDRLHYYPDTGFVYYDGIVNDSSEYDGAWYTANPGIKPAIESALSVSVTTISQAQSIRSNSEVQSRVPVVKPQSIMLISGIAGLTVVLLLVYWRRRSFVH